MGQIGSSAEALWFGEFQFLVETRVQALAEAGVGWRHAVRVDHTPPALLDLLKLALHSILLGDHGA